MRPDQKTDRVFDKRVVRRNVAAGRVSADEYASFLAALPDLAQNIKARDDGGDDDGYDHPIRGVQASHEPERAASVVDYGSHLHGHGQGLGHPSVHTLTPGLGRHLPGPESGPAPTMASATLSVFDDDPDGDPFEDLPDDSAL